MNATILCLETATTNCSVALSQDGELRAMRELNNQQYSHAEKLHLFITEVLAEAKLTLSDVDAVAVSKGPGSYTGLRIGVSAAKGLCFALGIPLLSIPTLDALAAQVHIEDDATALMIPMLDARRMEVYAKVLNAAGEELRATQAEILSEETYASYLKAHKVYFIGDGASKYASLCTHKNAIFIKDSYPSAKEMISLAHEKWKANQVEDVAYFEPFYLKDFVAGKKKK